MDFYALDVETANPDLASICQIGIVSFVNGEVWGRWSTLVDPEDYFDGMCVYVHGITEQAVQGAPTFPQLFPQLMDMLSGRVVAHHTAFDRVSLERASKKYQVGELACSWLDTARVARRAWEQFRYRGYGLDNLAQYCGVAFRHHDAVEDARAAGEILLRAMEESGVLLDDWLKRAYRPISSGGGGRYASAKVSMEGNPDGHLAGEVIVFTGALSLPRQEAAKVAAEAGCDVRTGVSKKTTLLVVGDQDIRYLAGHKKSSKHRRAEELIAGGHPLRILQESDFLEIVGR